jgi:hypothetical protein
MPAKGSARRKSDGRGGISLKRLVAFYRGYENYILGVTLILVWILPGYLLSDREYSLEYDYIQNVRVAASLGENTLLPLNFGGFNFIPEHQGSEILRLMLCKLSGLPIQDLQILPIGAFLVPLTFFVLCKECFGKRIAALLSISVAFDPTIVMSSYHTTIYAWSRPMLLMFVYLYVKILDRRTPALLLLSIILFISLYSIYWTDPALMVVFALFINIIILIPRVLFRRQEQPIPRSTTIYIATAFTVIYLGFGEFAYNLLPSMFSKYASGQFGTAVFSLYQRVLQLVGLAQPAEEVFSTYGESSPILTIQLIRYLLMIIPVGLLLLKEGREIWKTRKITLGYDPLRIIMWALVGVLLFHTFLYSSYGHASTRYVAILGPIIAMIALDRFGGAHGKAWILPALLGIMACFNFIVEYPATPKHSNFAEVEPAANWFLARADQKKITSNVGTYGMFALMIAPKADLPMFTCYSDSVYAALTDPAARNGQLDALSGYIILDRKVSSHEMCPGFKFFEPLTQFLDSVSGYPGLDWIYDNGSIWILKPE